MWCLPGKLPNKATRGPARRSPLSSPSSTRQGSRSRRSARPSPCWRWCSTRADRAEPRTRQVDGEAAARGAPSGRAADCRARRGRRSSPPHSLPAARARARRQRHARRRARAAHLGRRRRAAWPLARLSGRRKTGRPRWVDGARVLFEAITALVARDDSVPERPVFQGFGADRFRTALARACTPPVFPPSRRTTSATDASSCSTLPACRGRGSARASATTTS